MRLTSVQRERLEQSKHLFVQANALLAQGKKTDAVEAVRRGLAGEREVFKQVRPYRCDWLALLARLLEEREDFTGAENARAEALTALESAFDKDHWCAIDALQALNDGKRRAKMTPEQRKQLARAVALHNQAVGCRREGKPAEGLLSGRQALEVRRALLGEKHTDCAASLTVLACLYHDEGDYQAALPLYKQALGTYQAALGEKHPSYGRGLNNLASLYQDRGDCKTALPLLEQALAIKKAVRGEKHPEYATSLNLSFASSYVDIGN